MRPSRWPILILLLWSVALPCAAQVFPAPWPKTVTPEAAWQTLMAGNATYVAGALPYTDLAARRDETAGGQHPPVTILSCSDSRVPPELVFGRTVGDLFVVRVAGEVADSFAIASIEYAIEHDWTKLIVVMGHEECGAVVAALSPDDPPTASLVILVQRILLRGVVVGGRGGKGGGRAGGGRGAPPLSAAGAGPRPGVRTPRPCSRPRGPPRSHPPPGGGGGGRLGFGGGGGVEGGGAPPATGGGPRPPAPPKPPNPGTPKPRGPRAAKNYLRAFHTSATFAPISLGASTTWIPAAFQRGHLLRRGSFAAADDRAGMTHAPSRRGGLAGDEGHDRLGHVLLHKRGRLLLRRAADLTDHDDGLGGRIVLERGQAVDEVRSRQRIAADADRRRLADGARLTDGFVRQSSRARHDADRTRAMDVARHDADLRLRPA